MLMFTTWANLEEKLKGVGEKAEGCHLHSLMETQEARGNAAGVTARVWVLVSNPYEHGKNREAQIQSSQPWLCASKGSDPPPGCQSIRAGR